MKSRIEIENYTLWSTTDLRRIIFRAAKEELPEKRRAVVTIKYLKHGSWTLGHAYYNSTRMTLFMPRDETKLNRLKLLGTIIHEMGHMRNVRHRDMHNLRYSTAPGWREYFEREFPWYAEMPLRMKAPRPKSPRPGPEEKLQHAIEMLAEKERRIKRLQTMAKKWRAKVRYYDRQLKKAAESKKTEAGSGEPVS